MNTEDIAKQYGYDPKVSQEKKDRNFVNQSQANLKSSGVSQKNKISESS